MRILYILIYWLVSAFILLMPTIFSDVNEKLTWKDWVPTFILAPLIFPFYMIMGKYSSGLFGVDHKDKPTEKQKKKD